MHNAAIDVLRRRQGDDVPLSDVHQGSESPERAYEQGERLRETLRAVQAFPPRQREATRLGITVILEDHQASRALPGHRAASGWVSRSMELSGHDAGRVLLSTECFLVVEKRM